MAEVKNVVPGFEEFSKDPEKYMSELGPQGAAGEGAAQPAPSAQPAETDSILGAQAGSQGSQSPAQPAPKPEGQPAQSPEGGAGSERPEEKEGPGGKLL